MSSCCDAAEEIDAGRRSSASRCGTTAGRARPVRHHRRRPRLLRRAGGPARDRLGYAGRRRRRPASTPRAARRSSSATWSTAGRRTPAVLRLVMGMVDAGTALCVPGNHDVKLLRAPGPRRADHATAWPSRWRSSRTSRPSSAPVAEFLDGPREPLRPRRRQAGRRARRDEGGDAGPGLGGGARLRALRRDDRRDRRVRPAGALPLGGGVPGPRDGRLRPHAGARAGVAQPHDQHRHRLRLRRQADGAALPGAGARLGPRPPDLLRAGPAARPEPSAPRAPGAAARRRRARHRRRARQAHHRDAPARER